MEYLTHAMLGVDGLIRQERLLIGSTLSRSPAEHQTAQMPAPEREPRHFQQAAHAREWKGVGSQIGRHLAEDSERAAEVEQDERSPQGGQNTNIDPVQSRYDLGRHADDH